MRGGDRSKKLCWHKAELLSNMSGRWHRSKDRRKTMMCVSASITFAHSQFLRFSTDSLNTQLALSRVADFQRAATNFTVFDIDLLVNLEIQAPVIFPANNTGTETKKCSSCIETNPGLTWRPVDLWRAFDLLHAIRCNINLLWGC
jgi:hypothetical protein